MRDDMLMCKNRKHREGYIIYGKYEDGIRLFGLFFSHSPILCLRPSHKYATARDPRRNFDPAGQPTFPAVPCQCDVTEGMLQIQTRQSRLWLAWGSTIPSLSGGELTRPDDGSPPAFFTQVRFWRYCTCSGTRARAQQGFFGITLPCLAFPTNYQPPLTTR